jgi:microcystin-dependent protein
MSDSFSGNRAPFIDLAAATDITGSTVLTEAQLAAHSHSLFSGTQTGLTDTVLSFASQVQNDTVVAGNRDNTGGFFIRDNNNNQDFVETIGSSAGHTHAIPAIEVDLTNNSDAFQIMPYSYHFQTIQYVP